MEKADPDDLSVELTTFDEEAELSSSMLESEASHHQQHQEYAISGPSGSTTPALQAPVSSSGEQATTTRSNATATNKSPSLPTSLLEEIHQLPKEIRNIIAGGFAGMIAKSIVAPFDRIKILYQVSSAEFQIRKIPAIARRIVHEEGISALWKGNTATLIRVFPYSGIQFMVFDRCKTYILREQERNFLREKKNQPFHTETELGPVTAGEFVCGDGSRCDIRRSDLSAGPDEGAARGAENEKGRVVVVQCGVRSGVAQQLQRPGSGGSLSGDHTDPYGNIAVFWIGFLLQRASEAKDSKNDGKGFDNDRTHAVRSLVGTLCPNGYVSARGYETKDANNRHRCHKRERCRGGSGRESSNAKREEFDGNRRNPSDRTGPSPFHVQHRQRLVPGTRHAWVFQGCHPELVQGTNRVFDQLYLLRYHSEFHGNGCGARTAVPETNVETVDI
mmetsp:Transcript_18360/g.41902  ORF Transcript_18360/g.41902 Transcript_18360/m.41902 type:complete len:446 (+) Transcript_18360:350-1687(+)